MLSHLPNDADILLIKFEISGFITWGKIIYTTGISQDLFAGAEISRSGYFLYVVFNSDGYSSNTNNLRFAKIQASDGIVIFVKGSIYGTTKIGSAHSISLSSDNNFLYVPQSIYMSSLNSYTIGLIKLDLNFDVVWY